MIRTGKLALVIGVFLLSACASTGGQRKAPVQVDLHKIVQELPEAQLLDVWIEQFEPGVLPKKEKNALGLSTEIRQAEARYIPIHLRGVMEKTGYWGAVRVVPQNTEGAEILVSGLILNSNGADLELKISAEDASGRVWFRKTYSGEVDPKIYDNLAPRMDAFQMVYRLIANDLVKFRNQLSDQERIAIRQFADVRFAADMAPDTFAGHLRQNEKGRYNLERLPAVNDPAFQRVQIIRERDYMLIDTLNGHYDNFYLDMSNPYMEWRKAQSVEAAALREVKRKANTRMLLGAAAILGAIAIEAMGSRSTRASTGTLRDVMVLGGAVAVKSGIDIRSQGGIHTAAIEELGYSFTSEAQPLVVEVDGEIHTLTGSAEAQYKQWRALMREIYTSETGFDTLFTEPVSR
ncbi:MAG: hypothetical protein L3J22_05360 [Xanthomonadales bacterium]|nr:hypothetical protein [Xanthomonadales bacterium]